MTESQIRDRVYDLYWKEDLNCATASLKILAESFYLPLEQQVVDSALGMHGAACFGAQCGLVEGPLLFLGIYGRRRGIADGDIRSACYDYADRFQKRFGSLQCRELRPGGFSGSDPEHLCENITAEAVVFAEKYLVEFAKSFV